MGCGGGFTGLCGWVARVGCRSGFGRGIFAKDGLRSARWRERERGAMGGARGWVLGEKRRIILLERSWGWVASLDLAMDSSPEMAYDRQGIERINGKSSRLGSQRGATDVPA